MTIELALVGTRIWLGATALIMFGVTVALAILSTQILHEMAAAKRAGFIGLIPLRRLRLNYGFAVAGFLSAVSASSVVIAALVITP